MAIHNYLGGKSYGFVAFKTDKLFSIEIPIRKTPYQVSFANAGCEIFTHDASANVAPLLTKTTELKSIDCKQFNYFAETNVTYIHGPSCIMASYRRKG